MMQYYWKYIYGIKTEMVSYYRKNKFIENYYSVNNKKKALLSYITKPFLKRNNFKHTNYYEARIWAETLNDYGYQVDVINFNNTIQLNTDQYDLICGFGNVFKERFRYSKKKIKMIFYATGAHVNMQNHNTLSRLKSVYEKKEYWLGDSTRYVDQCWTHQSFLSDAIVLIDGGGDIAMKSYQNFYNGPIYRLPVPSESIIEGMKLISERSEENKINFLFFGSTGMIHKGLDVLLEYFYKNKKVNLHICSSIDREVNFKKTYIKELMADNIYNHGFVSIKSDKFKDVLSECDFVISPSCSEAGNTSIYNVISNSGLIPIVSPETNIKTGHEINIPSISYEGIEKAIQEALSLSDEKIRRMRVSNYKHTLNQHNKNSYKNILSEIIKKIIEK